MNEIIKKDLERKVIVGNDDIFTASFYSDISKLKEFIVSGKYTTEDFNSALSLACERGNIEATKLLLKSGPNDLENALLHSTNILLL